MATPVHHPDENPQDKDLLIVTAKVAMLEQTARRQIGRVDALDAYKVTREDHMTEMEAKIAQLSSRIDTVGGIGAGANHGMDFNSLTGRRDTCP